MCPTPMNYALRSHPLSGPNIKTITQKRNVFQSAGHIAKLSPIATAFIMLIQGVHESPQSVQKPLSKFCSSNLQNLKWHGGTYFKCC